MDASTSGVGRCNVRMPARAVRSIYRQAPSTSFLSTTVVDGDESYCGESGEADTEIDAVGSVTFLDNHLSTISLTASDCTVWSRYHPCRYET